MSPRRHRHREPAEPPPLALRGFERVEGEHVVRTIPGERATKVYRCPGCDQEIRPGVAHVVAWQVGGDPEVDRRHWHTSCWRARSTRRMTRRRG